MCFSKIRSNMINRISRATQYLSRLFMAGLFITIAGPMISPTIGSVTQSPPIRIVTTTPEVASLVREIGQSHVKVVSLTNGFQDLHHIEPKPSMVFELKKADLLFRIGMAIDDWASELAQVSGKTDLLKTHSGNIDLSVSIPKKLGIPLATPAQSNPSPYKGDVHAQGNPHYTSNPENARYMIDTITQALTQHRPELAAEFKQNKDAFRRQLDQKIQQWKAEARPMSVITFHSTWTYLADFLPLTIVDTIEEVPGIQPSPARLTHLVNTMKNTQINAILMAPYYPKKPAQFLSKDGQIPIIVLTAFGEHTKSYIEWFDDIVNTLYHQAP